MEPSTGRSTEQSFEGSMRRSPSLVARAATAITLLYSAFGVMSILLALTPAVRAVAEQVDFERNAWVYVLGWPSFGYGTLLLLLARSLRKRKRAAWRVLAAVVTLNTLGAVALVLTYRNAQAWAVLAVFVLLLAVVLYAQPAFTVLGDPKNLRAAVRVLAVLLGVCLLLGSTLVTVLDASHAGYLQHLAYTFTAALTSVELFEPGPLTLQLPHWVGVLLNTIGTLALLGAGWALFGPRRDQRAHTAADDAALRRLLATAGPQDSLGYFALRPDKSLVFSASGKAAIAYRTIGDVCLASGDPLGHSSAWPEVIEAWRMLLREHGWIPAVLGASERGAQAYATAGLDALELGDEAVVDTTTFSLEGRAVRSLRQAVNRVARTGMSVRLRRQGDVAPAELVRLAELAEHWRAGEVERGFSMALGRVGEPGDDDLLIAECLDAQGRSCALLTFVPWGRDGLSLDLMRRDRDVELNGLTEFAVTSVLTHAPELGVQRVSLNFAVFRTAFDRGGRLGAGPVLRLWRRVLTFGSRWWQLESLYRANVKYQPQWTPRFLCFASARDVPKIGIAAARAEGFLPSKLPG
ncbi:protein of unknown function DUF470 [Kineococcus radiotolerans SRS30216 = ATCC BAA-149]|uniref:Phosphatidylglycerol lysyltransferase C-terminal domain-containing protein n=2 Tax=Kineococcus radiotolerans TaxID=131568 RepID=A6WAW3_KINRD|nr:protein of unknown function DUF470 [Kineococcus radiotolerans SRS30216 = ATCC BAA-149]